MLLNFGKSSTPKYQTKECGHIFFFFLMTILIQWLQADFYQSLLHIRYCDAVFIAHFWGAFFFASWKHANPCVWAGFLITLWLLSASHHCDMEMIHTVGLMYFYSFLCVQNFMVFLILSHLRVGVPSLHILCVTL